jgi:hypothetical protein
MPEDPRPDLDPIARHLEGGWSVYEQRKAGESGGGRPMSPAGHLGQTFRSAAATD